MRSIRVIAPFLTASLAAGCASGSGASPASMATVRPAAVDPGGASHRPGTPRPDRQQTPAVPSLRAVTTPSAAATAEVTDPRLAAALRAEAEHPSADHALRAGREYLRLGLLDSAYAQVQNALTRNRRLAEAHDTLARVWREWGLPDRGIGPSARAAYFDPASAAAANTMGTLLNALGHRADARTAFARALALDPGAAWALNNLCFIELQTGRLSEARGHCEAALDLNPALIVAHNNLALTYVAAGDPAAARLAFAATGDAAGAAYNRGIVHLAKREYAAAAADFEEAIAARPGFTAAKTHAHDARMRALTHAHD